MKTVDPDDAYAELWDVVQSNMSATNFNWAMLQDLKLLLYPVKYTHTHTHKCTDTHTTHFKLISHPLPKYKDISECSLWGNKIESFNNGILVFTYFWTYVKFPNKPIPPKQLSKRVEHQQEPFIPFYCYFKNAINGSGIFICLCYLVIYVLNLFDINWDREWDSSNQCLWLLWETQVITVALLHFAHCQKLHNYFDFQLYCVVPFHW